MPPLKGVNPMIKKIFVVFCLSVFLIGVSSVFAGQLPSYKTVCKELKDLPDWQAEKCEGINVSGIPTGEMVSANRPYTQGNKRIEATIICGMQAMGYWEPFASHIQMDSDEEFVEVTNIDGFPVGIGYHKQDKSGGIVVKLTKKESITAVFVVNFENMDWNEALDIAKKFDWKGMKELF